MLLRNFLKSQSVFKGLSDHDCDALAHAFGVRGCPDGHTIIKEGQTGKELYLLVEGHVKVARYNSVTGLLGGQDQSVQSLLATIPFSRRLPFFARWAR